jgi:hypothetical protein
VREIRAGPDPRDGLPHLGIEVAEGLERERRAQTGVRLDLGPEVVVGERLHAALAVMDEHDLGGVQQSLRDDQRPDHVVGDHPARVADDVRVPWPQPEHRVDVQARVHAGHDRDAGGRAGGEAMAGEVGGIRLGVRQ